MLTAIIVYLIIGAIIVLLLLRNVLADMVKNDNLAVKVICCIAMIVVALPGIIYGFTKGFYREFKNKSES